MSLHTHGSRSSCMSNWHRARVVLSTHISILFSSVPAVLICLGMAVSVLHQEHAPKLKGSAPPRPLMHMHVRSITCM
jgi:hypothetical protein